MIFQKKKVTIINKNWDFVLFNGFFWLNGMDQVTGAQTIWKENITM